MEKYLQEITNLTEEQLSQFKKYYEILVIESNKYNLTNLKTEEDIYIKHFLDSIIITKYIDFSKINSLVDIGTGAGFPGLPLKIINPSLKVTLVEPTQKRCKFLEMVVKELNLSDVTIINDRAENIARNYTEKFDLVTARAVAPLNILLELTTPFAKLNGLVALLKGDLSAELINAKSAISKLKIKQKDIYKFDLPLNAGSRTIIEFIKTGKTPDIYPRAYAKIKKQPL